MTKRTHTPRASITLFAAGIVACASHGALAGTTTDTTPPSDKPVTHATESVESCMRKWDPGTHMTKDEWRETCRRIHDERAPYVKDR